MRVLHPTNSPGATSFHWLATPLLAVALAVAGGTASASAVVQPDHGPTAGGTTVTAVVPGGDNIVRLTGGLSYTVAQTSSGATFAWGANNTGQLGDGTTSDSAAPVAVHVPTGATFTAVDANYAHSLAIDSNGALYAWGTNVTGQLGTGDTLSSPIPVLVQSATGLSFSAVSAGVTHSMAIGSDGNTYAWGSNY